MQALIMEKGNPAAWMFMPVFRSRIVNFDKTYTLDGTATNIADLFEQCFAAGDKRMLGMLLWDQTSTDSPPTGHLIAGIDTYHGCPQAVIYQYEKDNHDATSQATNDLVQSVVDTWALSLGLRNVSALALSHSRAKHFEHWGYRYSATLVTRRIGDGKE